MKESNKVFITLIIILVIIIMGLVGYIVYDKVLSNNETNNSDVNNSIMKAQDYVTVEDIIIEDENRDIKMKEVKFKNLDNNLVKKFLDEQNEVINRIKNREVTSGDIIAYEGSKYVVNTDVWYQINNDILTVYYEVNEMSYEGLCPDNVITTNIDLKNNKVLSNEEILKLVNYSFQDIAEKEYNQILKNLNEGRKLYIDSETEITKEEFINTKTSFINKIVSGLDDVIDSYIENGEVKYDVGTYSIEQLYREVAKGGCLGYVTEIVGSLEKNTNDVNEEKDIDNLTEEELLAIVKDLSKKYFEYVTSLGAYCGEYNRDDTITFGSYQTQDYRQYWASATYNSINEIKEYYQSIMIADLIPRYLSNGVSYLEQDGKLYCEVAAKGPAQIYHEEESEFKITSVDNNVIEVDALLASEAGGDYINKEKVKIEIIKNNKGKYVISKYEHAISN